jgi:hypothetical protein
MVSSIQTSVGNERKVSPSLPGPKSRALHERRRAPSVSAGLTTGLPHLHRTGRGRDPRRRRRQPDPGPGLGHRRHDHRPRRARTRRRGERPGGGLHPHLLHGHALRELRRGLRGARRAHARLPRQDLGAVQLRLRGRGERRQGRATGDRAARPSSSSTTPTTAAPT